MILRIIWKDKVLLTEWYKVFHECHLFLFLRQELYDYWKLLISDSIGILSLISSIVSVGGVKVHWWSVLILVVVSDENYRNVTGLR